MKKQRLKKNYLVKYLIMNKFSDKNVIIVILTTILVVFAFAFSVKSTERRIIDSPIIWKEDFSMISIFEMKKVQNRKSLIV